ncbi:ATP-dependent RNA helicase DHX8 [Zea mays]|uniref:RNA helicase n=1 Tax=Zea mays TaxID=4577 RepID=A0A1D6G549_MAIZE|nr:ATP-dependent RNA helicase DHX8 [Zea mays]
MPSFSAGASSQKQQFARGRQLIRQQRKSLPIASVEKRLVEEVRNNDTLIIVGETGSGKTTQLPQFLYDGGLCQDGKVIGITQPRRVAAVTVAKRVAEECNDHIGKKVGYSIRFDDSTSNATRIKYMTDGLLLREALLDPLLSKYSVIVVDEAHERTVHTDVLLGLLKKVQHSRANTNKNGKTLLGHSQNVTIKECQGIRCAPLKLIIMSASLDAKCFSDYFGGAKAVHIQGRQYPVDILYTYQPESDYMDATLVTIFQIHLEEGPGDILAFLTGQEEIESLERLIHERARLFPPESSKICVTPIYSSLPSEQQMNAFKPAPAGTRKVVLATNIAETSVTIPGIKYVIDPGMVKARAYNPVTGMESLIIIPVSKAQALQRSGRAGREGPGKCFRLFQESEFDKLVDSTVPEIKRCNLSNVVLQLKALGIDDIIGFDFMEKPSRTDDYKLSDPVGHQMARLPLDPMYSKSLIVSSKFKCLEEMLIVVSMLSVESIFFSVREKLEEARAARKRFESSEGDHITLVNVYRGAAECLEKSRNANAKEKTMEKALNRWCRENFINYRSLRHARDVHRQIQGHVQQMGLSMSSCGDDMVLFRRCLTSAFFLNAAMRQPDGSYRALATGQSVQIHPSSVLFRTKVDCVIFNELVRTTQNYIKNLTRIDPLWLAELAPQYYATEE